MDGEIGYLLLPGEAAKILRVTVPTLRRWVVEGKLRAVVLPGGTHRYPMADIRAMARGERRSGG